mgnify:CR=1 FL=1|tara:strand:- start:107 stop:310 length:204 start_codon:yes stop_codon:yes gene_type:complete
MHRKELKGGENMVNVDELMADIKRATLCHISGDGIEAKLILNAVIKELHEVILIIDEEMYGKDYLGS